MPIDHPFSNHLWGFHINLVSVISPQNFAHLIRNEFIPNQTRLISHESWYLWNQLCLSMYKYDDDYQDSIHNNWFFKGSDKRKTCFCSIFCVVLTMVHFSSKSVMGWFRHHWFEFRFWFHWLQFDFIFLYNFCSIHITADKCCLH